MKTIITILIAIAQIIGYSFLVIAGYYLYLAKGFTGEYAMGFGIALLYGSTTLFISSLVAIFFKKYYSDKVLKYFKQVIIGIVVLFLIMITLSISF